MMETAYALCKQHTTYKKFFGNMSDAMKTADCSFHGITHNSVEISK